MVSLKEFNGKIYLALVDTDMEGEDVLYYTSVQRCHIREAIRWKSGKISCYHTAVSLTTCRVVVI